MKFAPYAYQQAAIAWVADKPRCCLFMDMGLGKTVSTLTAFDRLRSWGDAERALVIAPKKVAEATWSAETAKWDHLRHLRVVKVMGSPKKREAALASEADVYVIGRDSLAWLLTVKRPRFDMVIVDELTSFKNPRAHRFKALRLLSAAASRVVGLTGTPAPNGYIDLWAQLYAVDLGQRLGKSITRYRDAHFDTYVRQGIVMRCTLRRGEDAKIMSAISDICLTMEARDYLELPPMIVTDEYVELPEDAAKAYADFERERVLEFKTLHEGETGQAVAASAAALMAKLGQMANGAVYGEGGEVAVVHWEKIDRLAEIAETSGDSLLVFYQYRHDADRVVDRLGDRMRVRRYDGEADLAAWNAGDVDVLLAHPAAAAFGLNLQAGGRRIVWLGTGWNLELYQQGNARLHRQGQQRPVMVHRLLCPGTVDMLAAAALDGKKSTQQGLIDGLKSLLLKC